MGHRSRLLLLIGKSRSSRSRKRNALRLRKSATDMHFTWLSLHFSHAGRKRSAKHLRPIRSVRRNPISRGIGGRGLGAGSNPSPTPNPDGGAGRGCDLGSPRHGALKRATGHRKFAEKILVYKYGRNSEVGGADVYALSAHQRLLEDSKRVASSGLCLGGQWT